jgi:hypothetical protein
MAVPHLGAERDRLPSIIDTLITAVRNGELDEQLALVGKVSAKRRAA